MTAPLRIGIGQLRSSDDPWENLALACAFVDDAAIAGCELVCLPENLFYRGPRSAEGFDRSDYFLSLDDGQRIEGRSDFARAVAEAAESWPLYVSLGSVFETGEGDRPYNSHWLVAPGGEVASYRKVHLFDFASGPVRYKESDDFAAGRGPRSFALRDGFRAGLSICFDLRFPELYRDLALRQGANVLLAPAAFTRETGAAHWHTLLRARAIENQSYVVASAQWGSHRNASGQELYCFGHSLVYDPWGECLAEAPAEGDALLIVDLERERLEAVRARLPALECVRLFK